MGDAVPPCGTKTSVVNPGSILTGCTGKGTDENEAAVGFDPSRCCLGVEDAAEALRTILRRPRQAWAWEVNLPPLRASAGTSQRHPPAEPPSCHGGQESPLTTRRGVRIIRGPSASGNRAGPPGASNCPGTETSGPRLDRMLESRYDSRTSLRGSPDHLGLRRKGLPATATQECAARLAAGEAGRRVRVL